MMGSKITGSHDARLREVFGEGTRKVVDRICAVYADAWDIDHQNGAAWYPSAYQFCAELAEATGHTVERVAAVTAHLSTRCRWERNKIAATMMVTSNGETLLPGMLSEPEGKALVALHAEDPWDTFGDEGQNPKTRRFMRNILGDRDVVTIDTWAMKVAFGIDADKKKMDNGLKRKGVYEAVQYAYQVAGARLGVCPVTLQAVTWCVIRGHKFD